MREQTLLGGGALIVLHNVGLLLRYMGVVPLALLPVAAYYREWIIVPSILLMAAAMFGVGHMLSLLPTRRDPRLREGLLIAAAGWLVVPGGSVILFIHGEGWNALDAYLECMSAWTGTGVSVADVTMLSRTSLMWRSVMQWVGGLGVIVLTLAILARPGTGAFTLYAGEAREDKLRPSILSTVRTLWKIYLGLSILGIALLLAVGMSVWDAVNHALTAIATAGMSTEPLGIGSYDSAAVELALVPIMVLGSLPFVATYALMRGRWRNFVRDEQVKALALGYLAVAAALAWAIARHLPAMEQWTALRYGVFHGVSALSSTGFQSMDLTRWSEGMKLGIAGAMVLGGAAGSTAGGIKVVRGILLVKGAVWKLRKSGMPHFTVTTFRFGGERLSDQEANEEFAEASFILVLWVAMLFAGLLAFLTFMPGLPLADVIFEIASLQDNNGMSMGIVTATMPEAAKLVTIGLMWAGRLEILPALLLLRGLVPRFGKG